MSMRDRNSTSRAISGYRVIQRLLLCLLPVPQEVLESGQAGDQVFVTQGVGEAGVTRRSEGLTGNEGNSGPIEADVSQFQGGGRRGIPNPTAERPAYGREAVEGPFGFEAVDALRLVEHPMHDASTPVERLSHHVDIVE